jgi:hypothetical protein
MNPTNYSNMGVTTIIFTLSDGHASAPYSTGIVVSNRPPYYVVTPHIYQPINVHLNFVEKVEIPKFEDPEGYKGKVIVEDLHQYKISTSIDDTYTFFTVSPVDFNSVGSHSLTVSLNDDNLSESQTMTINVLNDAPVFTDPALQSYKM